MPHLESLFPLHHKVLGFTFPARCICGWVVGWAKAITDFIFHSSIRTPLYSSICARAYMHPGAHRAGYIWHEALPRYTSAHQWKLCLKQGCYLARDSSCHTLPIASVFSRPLNSFWSASFLSTPWSIHQALTDTVLLVIHLRINRVINRENNKTTVYLVVPTIGSGVPGGIWSSGCLPVSFSTSIFFSDHHTLAVVQEPWVIFKY